MFWNLLKTTLHIGSQENEIRIPGYKNVETYGNLKEVITQESDHYLDNLIVKAVTYNKQYRKVYMNSGLDALIKKIVHDAPSLATKENVLNSIREKLAANGIGRYNITCFSTNAPIRVEGHTFVGFDDIVKHVTCDTYWPSDSQSYTDKDIRRIKPLEEDIKGMEILEIYEKYPCFDIYDSINENRFYQNFFFSKKPFTAETVSKISKLPTYSNYCLCTEQIPEELLPMIYYCGEGEVLIMASK